MSKIIMFTTPTCGGCKIIKPMVVGANLPIEIVDATEDPERAETHNVSSVPAFVRESDDGEHIETLAIGAQEGIKFVREFESE